MRPCRQTVRRASAPRRAGPSVQPAVAPPRAWPTGDGMGVRGGNSQRPTSNSQRERLGPSGWKSLDLRLRNDLHSTARANPRGLGVGSWRLGVDVSTRPIHSYCKPAAALPAEVPGSDHAAEQGTRSILRIAEALVQHVEDSQAHVQSDEVREGERAHRVVHAELHDRVDGLGRADALHHREDRLVDHRHEDAVGDEAGVVVAASHGGLAQALGTSSRHGHRLVRGRLAPDQLDEWHQRNGFMKCMPRPCGVAGGGAELGDGDRRGVRRQNHRGPADPIEGAEQVALDLGVLDDGLDDVIRGGQIVERVARLHTRERAVAVGGGQYALVDEPAEAAGHPRTRAGERARRGVDQPHLESGLREDLCDAAPHRSGAHDAYRPDVHLSGQHGRTGER
jgi:hypothetical protein